MPKPKVLLQSPIRPTTPLHRLLTLLATQIATMLNAESGPPVDTSRSRPRHKPTT